MVSIQTLNDADRRTVARWAVACAERVLPLFDADAQSVREFHDVLDRARAYSAGEGSAAEEIKKRLIPVKLASAAETPTGAAVARAMGQAGAVAHMGAHALGAAAYAAKAVSLAAGGSSGSWRDEVAWQLSELRDEERAALQNLPALGANSAGPLGVGLLSRGILGDVIRELQANIGVRQADR